MSNESIEDLGAKLLLPVAVIGVIVMAVVKGLEVIWARVQEAWAWIQLHYVPVISVMAGIVTIFIALNVVQHRFPRIWKGLKIGCATFVILVIVLTIVLAIFANR